LEAAGAPSESAVIVRKRGAGTQEWKGFLWEGVPAEYVADFFSTYLTHPAARKVNSAVLADFVKAMAAKGELTSWTVAVIGGTDGAAFSLCGKYVLEHMITRNQSSKTEHYSIGRLLSPRDEAIDMDEESWSAAMRLTLENRAEEPGKEPPKYPGGAWIRQVRGLGAEGVPAHPERGLLLLYPIDPKGAELLEGVPPVVGFGVSFPASRSTTTVKYEVDHLLWETEYAPAD